MNKTAEMINTIKDLAQNKIPAAVNAGNVTEEDYKKMRLELNAYVIQALTGSTIKVTKKGQTKLHFNRPLPTTAQIHEIASIVDTYVNQFETDDSEDDADVQIPKQHIAPIEKASNKKLREAILGSGSISNYAIDGLDCLAIAASGAEARKRRNTVIAIAALGGLVVAAAGVTAGCMIYKKRNEDGTDVVIDEPVTDTDVDTEEDIPEVVLEEALA